MLQKWLNKNYDPVKGWEVVQKHRSSKLHTHTHTSLASNDPQLATTTNATPKKMRDTRHAPLRKGRPKKAQCPEQNRSCMHIHFTVTHYMGVRSSHNSTRYTLGARRKHPSRVVSLHGRIANGVDLGVYCRLNPPRRVWSASRVVQTTNYCETTTDESTSVRDAASV